MTLNEAILNAAERHLRIEEWPGARHNPRVVGMFVKAGHSQIADDETSWCAAFIAAVLAELGIPHSGSLAARSYLEWGSDVPLQEARPGDVVVLWRGSPSSWQGHVGFLVRLDGDRVWLRGGNQGNRVSDAPFPLERVLGVRRCDLEENAVPTTMAERDGRPILRHSDRGLFVADLQEQLIALRYPLGRVDRIFGDRTRAAVLAFQADNGIAMDGVVGPATWNALGEARPRPLRDVSATELRERESRTIRNADGAQAGTGAAVVVGGGTLALEKLEDAMGALEQAEGLLERAWVLIQSLWPVLLVLAIGLVIWHLLDRVKRARVDDARQNMNLGL